MRVSDEDLRGWLAKATPEPWHLVDDAQGPMMIFRYDGVCVASLTNHHNPIKGFVEIEYVGAPTRTANARLLAAAPSMARELLAARKVIASSRVVVEWAEPVTEGDWTEYDSAQRDLREYDAIMRDAPVEVPHGECPYPVHKDRSIKACVEAGDCGCGARDDGTTREG